MIGVTNSLGMLQVKPNDEREEIDSKSLFNPKPVKDAEFWFTKDVDIVETVPDLPLEQKLITQQVKIIKKLIKTRILN